MQCPSCHTTWLDESSGPVKYCCACGTSLAEAYLNAQASVASVVPGGELHLSHYAQAADLDCAPDIAAEQVDEIVEELLQRQRRRVELQGRALDGPAIDGIVTTFGMPPGDPRLAHSGAHGEDAVQESTYPGEPEHRPVRVSDQATALLENPLLFGSGSELEQLREVLPQAAAELRDWIEKESPTLRLNLARAAHPERLASQVLNTSISGGLNLARALRTLYAPARWEEAYVEISQWLEGWANRRLGADVHKLERKDVARQGAWMGWKITCQSVERFWERVGTRFEKLFEFFKQVGAIYEEQCIHLGEKLEYFLRHSHL